MTARFVFFSFSLLLLTQLLPSHASAELIHHWGFEEESGTTIVDSVGNAHGTMINMTGSERTSNSPFGTGKSLQFDASLQQHVDFGSSFVSLESDTDFSVSFWYKGNQISQSNPWGAFGLLSWDSNGIAASLSLQNGKLLYSHYDGDWQTDIVSQSTIADDEWNHIALVNHSNETADLWINGVKEIDGLSSVITSSFRIQNLMRGHKSKYVSGYLDEIQVYNHALSGSEVFSLSAVPEPSSLMYFAFANLLFAGRRRRKRTK